MKATIVIPLYHSHSWLKRLSRDLTRTCPSAEIIWVSDGDGDYAAQRPLPGAFIETKARGGFSGACNTGARQASGDIIILLNADTGLSDHWFAEILAPFGDPNIDIVGPAIFFMDGRGISSLGSSWNEQRGEWVHIGEGDIDHPILHHGAIVDSDMVTFACVAIRKSLWDAIGGLDERYAPAYWEDAAFCLEARSRGARIVVAPKSRIFHAVGSSGEGYSPRWIVNRNRYFAEWIMTGRQDAIIKGTTSTMFVCRLAARGDVLMAASFIRRLSLRCPQKKIEFVTSSDCGDVLAGNPDISYINTGHNPILKEAEIYDLDYTYERRPMMHPFLAYADGAGKSEMNLPNLLALSVPKIYPAPADRLAAKSDLPDGKRPWAVVCPTPTMWPSRNWPKERWIEVVRGLRERNMAVCIIGDGDEKDFEADRRYRPINTCRSAAVFEMARMVISHDSFPSHIAQAMKIPAITLFGPIRPELRVHGRFAMSGMCDYRMAIPVVGDMICTRCDVYRSPGVGQIECAYRQNPAPCMASIATERVLAEVDNVLARPKVGAESDKVKQHVEHLLMGRGMDIGCGNSPIRPETIAVDHRSLPQVDFVHDAQARFPVPDCWLDYVFSSHCLEHLERPHEALREWMRMLKTGGRIILYQPDSRYTISNPEHISGVPAPTLKRWLEQMNAPVEMFVADAFDYSYLVVATKR